MLNKYRNAHFDRIIEATNNLFLQPDSICYNCHANTTEPRTHHLNCIFCYCPLYDDIDCGGNYTILNNGLKDCCNCLKPHTKEFIKEQLTKLYENKESL
jgi:Zn-finger protein